MKHNDVEVEHRENENADNSPQKELITTAENFVDGQERHPVKYTTKTKIDPYSPETKQTCEFIMEEATHPPDELLKTDQTGERKKTETKNGERNRKITDFQSQ